MKIITNIVLVLIFAAAGISAQEKSTVSGKAGDESMIRANVEQMAKGWNMKSGAEFAKPFAENSDYVVINGMYAVGRASVAEGHQQIFDTIYKDSSIVMTVRQIRFLRPDVAVVHAQSNLTAEINGEVKKGSGMITMMMTKENGRWEIAAFQNTAIQSPAAAGGK